MRRPFSIGPAVVGRLTLAIGCMTVAPATAQMTPTDGDWTRGDPARCEFGIDSPDLAIRIRDGVLHGLESACDLTNPVPVRDMDATLYDMTCQGEGESWSYRLFAAINNDGTLTLIQNGWTSVMQRCEPTAPTQADPIPAK